MAREIRLIVCHRFISDGSHARLQLLHTIHESEYDGIVEEILVKNEETVEYGQPLFRIR